MLETLPDIFGNYALHDLAEIELPPPVPWYPDTTAWLVVFALLLLALILLAARCWVRYRHNTYRRDALKLLTKWRCEGAAPNILQRLPALIRGVALRAYPRELVTQLSGDDWLQFLDTKSPGKQLFQGPTGKLLLEVGYRCPDAITVDDSSAQQLFDDCTQWISSHRGDF